MPQQAMGGQPGVQSRPTNLPMQPTQQKQIQQIQPREFQTTFHGFSLVALPRACISINRASANTLKRKAPADPGERPGWDRIKPQPFPVSAKEFNSENRSARTRVSPYKAYEHLRTDSQREAIDRLINNFKAHETNPNAVWEIAYIKANRVVIPGTWGRAEETKDIRVIFKRSPLPSGQQPNPQVAQFPYGKIIDTTVEEPFPVPAQKIIQPQQPQIPPGQQQLSPKNPQQQEQMNQHPPSQQRSGPIAMPPRMGMNGQPPPPPNMPPPFGGNQLPPPPMQQQPPPSAMQGNRPNLGNAAPVTQIFNLAQPEKLKKQKSEKAKSRRRKSQSPHPRNKLRGSMDALEKVNKWQLPSDSDSESDNSDSGNSGSSVAAHRGYHHSAKKYKKGSYHIPPPPMGLYASGALTPRRSSSRSPPIVKRKSSIKEIRGKNKRMAERETAERYRRGSLGSSDGSYDMVDCPVSHHRQYDSTPPTSISSQSIGSSDRDSYGYKGRSRYSHRERSRSRQRTRYDRTPRRSRSRNHDRAARRDQSRSRDRSPYSIDRKSSLREHRLPDAYRGLTPPPQKQEPLIVHIHNSTNNNDRMKTLPHHHQQQQTALRRTTSYSPPPPSMDNLSLDDFSYAGLNPANPHHIQPQQQQRGLLPYPTADHLPNPNPILPRAPTVPTCDELRAQAAHEYMRNQQRRETLSDLDTLELLQRRKEALLIDKMRRERAFPARSPLPLRNDFSDPLAGRGEFARRPIRYGAGFGMGRYDDFSASIRYDNDWNRPSVPSRRNRNTNAGVRFGNGNGGAGVFDERDPFQYSR